MTFDLTKTSSLVAGCNAASQTMQRCGVDPLPVLAGVGLSPEDLDNPSTRVDSLTHCTFLESAYGLCGEPAFGLLASDFIHPTSYHNWGLALLSSSTLRSYLVRWERFYRLVSTHAVARLIEDTAGSRLEFRFLVPRDQFPGAFRIMTEANLAVALKYIRFRDTTDYQPLKAELPHRLPRGRKRLYRKYLGDNVVFGADRPAIWFHPDELDRKLPSANSELARSNDEVLIQYMARMDRADIPTLVRAIIVKLLHSGECS